MKNIVDLHSHTNKSDGTYTPNELLIEAENKGLQILSITDHETIDAYFNIDRNIFSGKLVNGIELRTTCFGIGIELIGYGFNLSKMKENLSKYKYMNTEELDKYLVSLAYTKYSNMNVKLDDTFVEDFDSNIHKRASKYIRDSIFKHEENIEKFEELDHSKSFFRYCLTNPSSPFFLDLSSAFPSISDIIKLIKDSDGLVSIPHIFEYKENSEKILNYLLDNYEIDIIECYYSSFTREQTNYLLDICKTHNKFISGGSDFHGTIRPTVELGLGTDSNLHIPIEQVSEWIDRI